MKNLTFVLSASILLSSCQMGTEATSSSSQGISSPKTSSVGQNSSAVISSATTSSSSTALSSSATSTPYSSANGGLSIHCPNASSTGTIGTMTSFECTVKNTGSQKLTLFAQRSDTEVIGKGWIASFCFGPTCYSPITLKSEMVALPAGDTTTLVYDVNPSKAGAATGTVNILDSATTSILLSPSVSVTAP